jgi:predicted ATPase
MLDDPLITEIRLSNLLSFDPDTPALPLGRLNVLIGPNASGKSNFIDAISLLQAAPSDLAEPVREGGGVREWLWKGRDLPRATLEAVIAHPFDAMPLRHMLSFRESMGGGRLILTDERIENADVFPGESEPHFYYRFEHGKSVLNIKDQGPRVLDSYDFDPEQSILALRKDPHQYREISWLADQLKRIRIYREWPFGRNAPLRAPQRADELNDLLDEDYKNLALVLNRLRGEPAVKAQLITMLNLLYPGIEDIGDRVEGVTIQVYFHEGRMRIPATRLSDGTLRFLCLLAILCDPAPPPLICIEEPELGLHPDILPTIGELLKSAAQRTQLVVTTHSEILVDSLSESPDDVIVCEKHGNATIMRRLNPDELRPWLDKYRLGELWQSGEIGGNRW